MKMEKIVRLALLSTYENGPVASRRLTMVELAYSWLIGFNLTMPFAYEPGLWSAPPCTLF